MKTRPSGKGFEDYYQRQIGRGLSVYEGSAMQRGHGIGNVIGRFLRTAKPIAQQIGKRALKAGVSAAKPMVKRALKQGVGAVAARILPSTQNGKRKTKKHAGHRVSRKPAPRKRQRGPRKTTHRRDIFA